MSDCTHYNTVLKPHYFFCNIFVNSSFVITPSPSGSSSAIISCNERERDCDLSALLWCLYLDLSLRARVAKTDHHLHQLISRNDAKNIKFSVKLTGSVSHPSLLVSNTLNAASISSSSSSSALFFFIKITNSC